VQEYFCLQLQPGSKPSVFSISVDSNGASQTAQDDILMKNNAVGKGRVEMRLTIFNQSKTPDSMCVWVSVDFG